MYKPKVGDFLVSLSDSHECSGFFSKGRYILVSIIEERLVYKNLENGIFQEIWRQNVHNKNSFKIILNNKVSKILYKEFHDNNK